MDEQRIMAPSSSSVGVKVLLYYKLPHLSDPHKQIKANAFNS